MASGLLNASSSINNGVRRKNAHMAKRPLSELCGSYVNYFDAMESRENESKIKEAKRVKLYPRERYVVDPPQVQTTESGEERFKQFEWYLENGFSWKRHLFQKEFHNKAAMVLAPQIIGSDWDRIGPALIKERKWDLNRNSRMLLGRGPRRFGKSVSMAMLAGSYSLVTPTSTQSIFSTSQRISVYLGELIYKAICDAGLKHRIKKFGEERMEIYGPDGSSEEDIRKIFYYPANAKIDYEILLDCIKTHMTLTHTHLLADMLYGYTLELSLLLYCDCLYSKCECILFKAKPFTVVIEKTYTQKGLTCEQADKVKKCVSFRQKFLSELAITNFIALLNQKLPSMVSREKILSIKTIRRFRSSPLMEKSK